jgi:cell division protein FtsW (lipid II flippase)
VVYHTFDRKEIQSRTFNRNINVNYVFALVFGLIHGLGFSNFFRSLTLPGNESDFVLQLLAFNIGVEIGQLTIVAAILLVSFLAFNILRIKQREYNLFVSGAAAGLSFVMMLERFPVN